MTALSQPLDDILGSRAKVRVCRLLLTTGEALSAREMGRRTGMAKRSVDLALIDLVQLGVVQREGSSSFSPYRINRTHAVVERALVPMVSGEEAAMEEMLGTLREAVRGEAARTMNNVVWAGLFGSLSRGDISPESDVDLAVVVEDHSRSNQLALALDDHASSFHQRFGRDLSVTMLTRALVKQMLRDNAPLATNLVRDGRRLTGSVHDIEELRDG